MATTQQIPLIAARLTEFQRWFAELSTEDAQWVIMNGKQAVLLCVAAIADRDKEDPAFVGPPINFDIPASTEKFIAKDKFKVNTSDGAEVKIFYMSNTFKEQFLSQVEEPFTGSMIYGRKLRNSSIDSKIVSKLDSHEKPEVTLREIYAVMAAQTKDESNILISKKDVNLFYARDMDNLLYAIHLCWNGKGWIIGAMPITAPTRWLVENVILYRSYLVA